MVKSSSGNKRTTATSRPPGRQQVKTDATPDSRYESALPEALRQLYTSWKVRQRRTAQFAAQTLTPEDGVHKSDSYTGLAKAGGEAIDEVTTCCLQA